MRPRRGVGHRHLRPARGAAQPGADLRRQKDLAVEPRPPLPVPLFAGEDLLAAIGSTDEPPPRFASAFPAHLDPSDLGIKFAGAAYAPVAVSRMRCHIDRPLRVGLVTWGAPRADRAGVGAL